MSFASDAREELARLPIEKDCCMRAEAAGMLQSGGIITLSSGRGLSVALEREQGVVARRAFALLKAAGLSPELRSREVATLNRPPVYIVQLAGGDATQALAIAGLHDMGLSGTVPRALLRASCCRRSFLRGAFLMSGSLNDPGKGGYHLEWRLSRAGTAEALRKILAREGIESRISQRREDSILYLKDADRITGALALMGAVEALLSLENTRVVKELRNKVNRQVNCESANVDKTTLAAQNQIMAIRLLEKIGVLRNLNPAMRETAELRTEYPEATLEELGALHKPPVGKSGVNHRLRRFMRLAEDYQRG